MTEEKPGDESPEQDTAADPAGHAQARAIPTVEERIAHIVGMMERFEWRRGKSCPELAELWGLALSTVERHSAEASRRIVGDRDEAQRDITVGARRLFLDCVNVGDAKGAKMMGDLWADVSGARAPEKHQHQLGALDTTPEKAREVMRELFGGVTPESDEKVPG